jgi:hypothetical protein
MNARAWAVVGGMFVALVVLVGVGILAAMAVARAQSPNGNKDGVVRLSGKPGTHYAGAIFDSSGRKDISGTLGDAPDEHPVSTDQGAVATVNKDPNNRGTLRLGLYVDGDIVDSTADDSGMAPLTVYSASAEH